MDEHVADAVERGAQVVHGGERADGFPTDLYWQPTVLDGVPPDSLVATEETFGPVAPVVAIDSLEHAIELANASPYGLLSAIFTRDLGKGLRYADDVKHRLGQRQRELQLLGDAPAVRRPLRQRERHRPRRRHGADGGLHRAADRRPGMSWDYVIVGGGSAGSALAARLTEDAGTQVLVLEAGRRDHIWDPFIHMPAALSFPIGNPRYDWMYQSEPEPLHARPPHLPRARQGARRLEFDQRDDLPARQPARLRALGLRGVGLRTLPPLLQEDGDLSRRRRRVARRRRPDRARARAGLLAALRARSSRPCSRPATS